MLDRRRFSLGAVGASLVIPTMAFGQAKTLKYANAANDQSGSNKFNVKLAELVDKHTNGAIKTQFFMGTLGGEQRLIENMSLGLLDIYNGAYTGIREFDVFYSPFFFKDSEQALRVLKGPIGRKASAKLEEKYKAKLIGVGRLGPYVVATKKKIDSYADLKGMKIRTPAIEGCVTAVKALGANPTPVPFTDIYLALQNSTIDGFVSALNPSIAGKFYEVCKYLVTPPFGEALDKQLISTRVWQSLTSEQQRIYISSFDELEVTDYFKMSETSVTNDIKTWTDYNGADSLLKLPQKELAELMAPVNEKVADEVYGPGSWKTIQSA